jgi:hypothetical protein
MTRAAKRVEPNDPRISGDTPIGQLVVCVRAIIRSEVGPCREGLILKATDPRVALAPGAFVPLADRTEGLFVPISDSFDR